MQLDRVFKDTLMKGEKRMNVRKIASKSFAFLMILVLMLSLIPSMPAHADYSGTLVSSLTDGDYLIVDRYSSSYSYYALGNTTAGSSGGGYGYAGVAVTVSGTTATVTDSAAVWTWNSSNKSFYNAASGKYLALPTTSMSTTNAFSSNPVALTFYTISGNEATVYNPSGNGGYYLNAAYPSNGKAFTSSYAKYVNSSYLTSGNGVYFYKLSSSTQSSSISVSPTSLSLTTGSTGTVTATPTGCTISGAVSSDSSVATVSQNGNTITVTAVGAGTATVSVTGTGSSGYSDPTAATFEVNVSAPTTYTVNYKADNVSSQNTITTGTDTSTTSEYTILSQVPTAQNSNALTFVGWTIQDSTSTVEHEYRLSGTQTKKFYTADQVGSNLYYPGQTITLPSTSTNLYPVWSKNSQASTEYVHFITYNANGGSGAPDAQREVTTTNSNLSMTVSTTIPSRDSHTFAGWNTSADGSGTSYQPGATISVPASSAVVLYAQWTAEAPDHVKSGTGTSDDYTISLNVTGKDSTATTGGSSTTTDKGTNLVMVIDISGSIVGKESALNSAIQSVVSSLPDNSQVGVVTFNDTTQSSKIYTKSSISGLTFSGDDSTATHMEYGIASAYSLLNSSGWTDSNNNKAMIVISDFDVDDYTTAINNAKTAKDGGTSIYCVSLTPTKDGVTYSGWSSSDLFITPPKLSELTSDTKGPSISSVTQYISSKYPEASAVNNSMFGMFNQATVTTGTADISKTYVYHNSSVTSDSWSEIFTEIQTTQGMTVTSHTTGVVIADTLSEYVELQNTSSSANYGVTVKEGNSTLASSNYTVTYDTSSRKITVNFGTYELTDSVIYTVNIPVKATTAAQNAADASDEDSVKLPTNTAATLTFQYGDEDSSTVYYEEIPEITVTKETQEKEYYLHHSYDGSIETIKWSALTDPTNEIDNVTTRIKASGYLYGGLFADAAYTTGAATPGTRFEPTAGETYYMREVDPTYLTVRNVYLTYAGDVIGSYGMAVVDDNKYKEVGFLYSAKTDPIVSGYKATSCTLYNSVKYPYLGGEPEGQTFEPKDIFSQTGEEPASTAKIAVGRLDDAATGTVQAYWITADNVLVTGDNIRTLENGLKQSDATGKISAVESPYSTAAYQESGLPVQSMYVAADEDEEENIDTGVKLAGYTTSLNGKIEMNFYLELSDEIAADKDAYMQFTLPGTNHTEEVVKLSDARTQVRGGKTYYVFSAGVAAKDMTSDIKAQFVQSDGTESDVWTYTVKDYCDYIRNHSDDYDEESVALVENMLNYGGYAQEYFKYNTDKLANADLDLDLPEVDLDSSFDAVVSGACDGLTYLGTSAMLTTTTGLRHYFDLEDAENYTFKASGDTLNVLSDTNGSYVLIDNIKAKDLPTPITLTVTDKDGNEFTLTYSVYSNVKQVVADDSFGESAHNLMKALYGYGEAAQDYFASRS